MTQNGFKINTVLSGNWCLNGVNTQWVYSQGVIQKPLDVWGDAMCRNGENGSKKGASDKTQAQKRSEWGLGGFKTTFSHEHRVKLLMTLLCLTSRNLGLRRFGIVGPTCIEEESCWQALFGVSTVPSYMKQTKRRQTRNRFGQIHTKRGAWVGAPNFSHKTPGGPEFPMLFL